MFGKIKEALSLERWVENFEGYLDARIELAKYDAREAMVGIFTKAVFIAGIGFFSFLALVCLNFGIAYWLNGVIGNPFAGFFILALFYLLAGALLLLLRKNTAVLDYLDKLFRSALNQPRLPEDGSRTTKEIS